MAMAIRGSESATTGVSIQMRGKRSWKLYPGIYPAEHPYCLPKGLGLCGSGHRPNLNMTGCNTMLSPAGYLACASKYPLK
jgi:hypothetical protein